MREGDPVSQIVRFAIPMLLGNVAQQLYNTVDSIIVGRFVGDNALAAVGSAGPILNLMIVLFIGISVGASIMVSQFFGAQKREDLAKAVGACITVTGAASVLIMIVGPLIAGPLLRLLNTPESIIGWCEEYLTIIFLGVLGGGYYNILSGVMRGLGDSASALRFLLVSTVVNTVLDYVFVAKFGMGVPGVAWATVIAQLVSAILALYKVMRLKDVFELKLHHLLPGRRYFGTLIRLGLPSGVTQAIFSMSMIVVQSLTNSFGEMFIAANVIVMRIDGFVMMPAFSLGTAMTTFAGQNIGAGLMDRVVKGARNGTLAAMGISAVITALILLFGRGLMGVFTTTQELIDLSFRMMKILAPGYIAMEVTQCLSGIMRGAGDTVTPMWISIFNTILVRVPLAYGLVALSKTPELPQGNCAMMYVSLLITWIIGAALTYILYRTGRWKRKAAVVLEATEN
ncbi:MAG: MATE family efflux transporter [Oscillospiraceae bacterium]|nr:MATE family efflux transporter [Oscillospiraceae bacterium]MBR2703087.1 MATE family efflux transporter [Oscillospiraceae bacterium]MBR2808326.1 MATE family efflux transporter [Oscillospiraceae bacterium]MBR4551782.1 MATE family efflux transporter [Oscillospiraceae bacterium]